MILLISLLAGSAIGKFFASALSFLLVYMNNLIFTSWNVRGINNRIAVKNVKRLLRDSRANILILQETKCHDWSDRVVDSFWDSSSHGWIAVNSLGTAGGLLISWDKQYISFSEVQRSHHWLWCKGDLPSGSSIYLVNVYGPHDLDEKQIFWSDLRTIVRQVSDSPICLIDDFNSIRNKKDRINYVYNNRDSINFNLFMEDTGLIELEGINFSFTWFGCKDKKSRLDRVLVNVEWLSYHAWKVHAGHRRNSDHLPLILSSDFTDWGPKSFKAYDNWLRLEEVQALLSKIVLDCNNKSWMGIMKELKAGLKAWKKESGDKQEDVIKFLEHKLKFWIRELVIMRKKQ